MKIFNGLATKSSCSIRSSFLLKSFSVSPIVFRVSCLYLAWNSRLFLLPWPVCSLPSHGSSTPVCPSLIQTGSKLSSQHTQCFHISLQSDLPYSFSSTGNSYLPMIQLFVLLLLQIFFDIYQHGLSIPCICPQRPVLISSHGT